MILSMENMFWKGKNTDFIGITTFYSSTKFNLLQENISKEFT